MKYRAEIDGLRALAVVPVIFFHAGFEAFAGGYVGVDVFFVISGYLITTILIEDIEKGRFSLAYFYERRARRILPALFFVMLVCIPFAWVWMTPSQLLDFAQSLMAVSLFASNFLFWKESGYFEAASEEKPLLHTWSLAVEEQYYVLFPLFMFFAWRFGKDRVFWMIVVMAGVSLALSEWTWRQGNHSANFYLPHTRAWELFAGSISAFIIQKRGVRADNDLSLLGLALILYSIFAYDETIPFPGLSALLPVLGTVLLVLYGGKGTIAARLLSLRLFVGIGLISYSAYLWHQPMFAFARLATLNEPGPILMLGLSGMSLILAAVSWRFVEQPFRSKSNFLSSRRRLTVILLPCAFFLMAAGVTGHIQKGFPERFEIAEFNFEDMDISECTKRGFVSDKEVSRLKEKCFSDAHDKHFIMIGDSHAESISKELRQVIESAGGNLITLVHIACLPIPDTTREPFQQSCMASKEQYWEMARNTDATIILAARWRLNMSGDRFDNEEGGIEKGHTGQNFVLENRSGDIFQHSYAEISELAQVNPVIVLSQIPEAGWHVPDRLFTIITRDMGDGQISTSYRVYKEKNRAVLDWLDKLSGHENITILRVEDFVCDDETGRCLNVLEGQPLYRDDDHPSPLFSRMISDKFKELYLE